MFSYLNPGAKRKSANRTSERRNEIDPIATK